MKVLLPGKPIIAILAIVACSVVVLRAFGRLWWCACGEFRFYATDVLSPHNSQHLVDAYSFTHVEHGLIFYGLFLTLLPRVPFWWRLVLAVLLESSWEILENSSLIIERYRSATMSFNYYGDTIVNSIGDIASCIAGFAIASRLPAKLSILLFVLVELGLLLVIRDNLTLNIIMLIWPLESIRSWQSLR